MQKPIVLTGKLSCLFPALQDTKHVRVNTLADAKAETNAIQRDWAEWFAEVLDEFLQLISECIVWSN
jgi:hypothetical protein